MTEARPPGRAALIASIPSSWFTDGIHAHTRLVYPPTHPAYADVLEHLDGLKPGESKLVPPWPDDAVSSPARSSDSSR